MNTKNERQPIKRYYLLAVINIIAALVYFPWSQGAVVVVPNALMWSAILIGIAVACVIRGRRNAKEAQ